MDAERLNRALALRPSWAAPDAVLVSRYGYIVGEQYRDGFSANERHESYSVAKSYVSALVGMAIADGALPGLDAPLVDYIPEWRSRPGFDRITVDHAMNLTTGLAWQEDWRSTATTVNEVHQARPNLLDYVLARPLVAEPGTVRRYSTGDPALLSLVLSRALGQDLADYAMARLLVPIGSSALQWGRDARDRAMTYAGIQATARDYARFGLLYRNQGRWNDSQLVPEPWVRQSTQAPNLCDDWCRYLWHQNLPRRLAQMPEDCPEFCEAIPTAYADLPSEGFFAQGIRGQFVFVLPAADLVIVRLAQDGGGIDDWDAYAREFLGLILDSLT